ncbi:hypothetical protein N0V93_004047 [Gnomoniopsis smithogilvyi]|uniref:FAD-binding domain-containing protein n=1 Tax=Gnomoniopsis smithogilvyi TaxID=1191159 RepID=A0A9W9D0F6_9PEZI|nr:hypothetical protein N0V93_004047 [Gnomoniopsis smithogilvyi]
MTHPTILIIGAGPIGLTLALALHHAGVPANTIAIADQRLGHTPSSLIKALSMNASSLEIFRILGIVDRFLSAGVPIHNAHFGGGRRLLDLNYEVLGTTYPFNYAIPQPRTEQILLARCEEVGVQFLWGRRFEALRDVEGAVVTTLEKVDGAAGESEDVTISWLVGCDGTRSAVREATDITWTGARATRYCWAGDISADPKAPSILTGKDEGGKTLFYSLGPGKARISGNIPPSQIVAGQRPTAPDVQWVREWSKRAFGRDLGVQDMSWSTVIGDGMWTAGTLRAGRILLAGDAAHQLFPAGGQGMNTGLLDVANLAWKLAMVATGKIKDQAVIERVLDSYSSERKPAIEAVVQNVRVQSLSMFSTTEKERAVAEFIAEALDQPSLNRLWATRVAGFGDPTEPYQHLLQAKDELVGTRVTHVADIHAGDVLQAASDNTFILAAIHNGSGDGEPEDLAWAKDLVGKDEGLFKTLDKPIEVTDHQKWAGVQAVLLRPDLRIAWVSREGSSISERLKGLSTTLEWWNGEPAGH